jgi:hypothetical protein
MSNKLFFSIFLFSCSGQKKSVNSSEEDTTQPDTSQDTEDIDITDTADSTDTGVPEDTAETECPTLDWKTNFEVIDPDPIVEICQRYLSHSMDILGVEFSELNDQQKVLLINAQGGFLYATDEQWSNPSLFKRLIVQNATERQALCNDGSPAVYYFRPSPTENDRWVIHLQGGSACTSPESCAERWGISGEVSNVNDFDSHRMSNCDEPVVDTFQGILSTEQEKNPDFYDWNLVLIEYCSSDTHNGDAAPSADREWYFRGKRTVHAIIADLQDPSISPKHRLSQATEVIFGGSSAGAGGLRMNLDSIQSELSHSQVCGISDAAYKADIPLPDPPPQSIVQAIEYLQAVPEESCYEETCDPILCALTTPVGLYHVQTPYFVQMDQHDSQLLSASSSQAEKDSLAAETRDLVRNRIGVFSPRFGGHVYSTLERFHNSALSVQGEAYTFSDVFGAWYFDRSEIGSGTNTKAAWKSVILEDDETATGEFSESQGGMCGGTYIE